MKVTIDADLCTGCGECFSSVPSVFAEGSDGLAVVTVEVVPAEKETEVRQTADDCPAAAIAVQ